MSNIIVSLVLMAIVGYLWGSLPSGYWMGKLLRGKDFDIREHGSHKTGATNVQRTLGTVPALIVLVIDLSKGVGPALLATFVPFFQAGGWGILIAGVAALLGHCYPVFIGFKGGRGVLTGAGSLIVASPLTFVIAAITTFGTIAIWRYVSLGSIIGGLTTIVCGIIFYFVGLSNPAFIGHVDLPQMLLMIINPVLVILFHADNIGRLLAGKERKFGEKVA
ncbi:MAG TPA: glycerol-3-phosphate 1-O-acyltransferase PlsY [Ktedonobacteraceae bacterium]|nr:glycerol-3-phosphate 1-O-acyltransferase PlsY [Ktedonobacteraceae bacterium]